MVTLRMLLRKKYFRDLTSYTMFRRCLLVRSISFTYILGVFCFVLTIYQVSFLMDFFMLYFMSNSSLAAEQHFSTHMEKPANPLRFCNILLQCSFFFYQEIKQILIFFLKREVCLPAKYPSSSVI